MVGVAVIGYGYWGPNYCRVFDACPLTHLVAVADDDPGRLDAAFYRYPAANAYATASEAINDARVAAVAVATPASTHYEVALEALRAGKHVFVAKPLAETVTQCRALELAAIRRVLLVDHTFLYTAAVRRLRSLIDSGDLGDPLYLDSVRVNLGLYQPDTDVVWDLAPHDLSIIHYLFGSPSEVACRAADRAGTGKADVAHVACRWPSGLVADVHVSWLSPVKVRRLMLGGTRRMVIYDDVEPDEKLRVYDSGVTVSSRAQGYDARVDYRAGDVHVPRLDRREALAAEAEHFADCIINGARPFTGVESGVAVVRLLEAASRSVTLDGAWVEP